MENSDKLKSKLKKMATTTQKKRKTTKSVVSSPRRKRATTSKAPVKRRRRLGSNAPGKIGLLKAAKNTLGGAMGGAIYTVPSFVIGLPWWGKLVWGVGGAIGLNLLKMPSLGSGQAGAMTNDLARSLMPTLLKDGDLEDAEYVDPRTLSDTGFEDEAGNQVVSDSNGNVFSLNDRGEYQMIGTTKDLPMNDGLPSVSMLPLQDNPYNLQDAYSLNSGY
jgi:hypothetical protein